MPVSNILASRVFILVSAAVSCLLSSCAVLTVDVDVYKGPLMNEERVQMLQLVSMIEGAKPLLVSLRDGIEWRDVGSKRPDSIKGYADRYIKTPDSSMEVLDCSLRQRFFTACSIGAKGFRNPVAARVNEVLRWYDEIPNTGSGGENEVLKGLDNLSLDYKQALAKPPSLLADGPDLKKVKDRLMDGLAQFAVRILFLANHDGLLADPDSQGWVSGGLGNLSRGLFGDSVTDAFSPMVYFDNFQGKGTLAGRKRLQYVRLLQAVGNSMLLSVNELREQEAARKGGDMRAIVEQLAMQATAKMDPYQVYANLIRELEEEKTGQDIFRTSLERKVSEIDKEMNDLETNASAQTASDAWKTNRDAEKKKYDESHDKLEGVLKLTESDKVNAALSKYPEVPAGVDAVWSVILQQVPKVLQDEKLSTKATLYLESVKDKVSFDDSAKKSYVKAWEAVKVYLDGQRKSLSDIERVRFKFARLITLYEEKEEQNKQSKIAKDKSKALETTVKLVEEEDAKGAVLNPLKKQGVFVTGRGVYLTLAMHLRKTMETLGTSDNTKKESIQTALVELNKHLPPPDFTAPTGKAYIDAKDVLDHEIALLRQEHIQAVRAGGEGADEVRRALDALEAAAQHRSGMVHIRPAAAYLRTSYPSTSLQDDPNLTWDNLLLQQGLRNFPFSSYVADLFNPESKHDRAISADLDKQYWQNINRVRVSGAGSTNYVLAKDDVGNWYVKHYFGDTARIFESARKLGMYNLGSTMGASLLSSMKDKQVKEESSSVDAQPIPLKRVFDQHRTAYTSKTTTDVTALKELAEKDVLATKIKEGWQSLPDLKGEGETLKVIEDGLPAPLKKLKDRMGEIEGNDKTRDGVRVVQEIQAIRNFHRALNAGVESLDLPIPTTGSLMLAKKEVEALKKAMTEACRAAGLPTNDCLTATEQKNVAEREFKANKTNHDRTVKGRAEKVVVDVLQEELSGLVQSRQRLLQDYEQAILFVGDASKN